MIGIGADAHEEWQGEDARASAHHCASHHGSTADSKREGYDAAAQ